MSKSRASERKPLSFSTTMRNPNRIVKFLNCLLPFENKILTHEVIMEVVESIISNRLYKPLHITRTPNLKNIYDDENQRFTSEQLKEIIDNSPQNHKEAGFAKGWESRFDTLYRLPMEFGFVYYEMNKPIRISNVGHMLIDALNESPVNEEKIQNVFLNSMIKYQTNNPFRKNENSNVPLILLLQVIDLLKKDPQENDAGVYRQELSLFICWSNNDAYALYNKIKEIRKNKKFNYSDEYIYDICLNILGVGADKKNRFKLSQITGEAIDEYIRKMRSTGIISLRGNGRFIDFNMIEEEKINYILSTYNDYPTFTTKESFFKYMGEIDGKILSLPKSKVIDINLIRKTTLEKYSKEYSKETIFKELRNVCAKKESKDLLLRTISGPARMEFLTSIALKQQFDSLDINPNYIVDDEGIPTCTALGGVADIVCYDNDCDSLVEVSLMTSKKQVNDEIIPIGRHLKEALKSNNKTFSIFVAPSVHPDAEEMAKWYKYKDDIDILTYNIEDFIKAISSNLNIGGLLSA